MFIIVMSEVRSYYTYLLFNVKFTLDKLWCNRMRFFNIARNAYKATVLFSRIIQRTKYLFICIPLLSSIIILNVF